MEFSAGKDPLSQCENAAKHQRSKPHRKYQTMRQGIAAGGNHCKRTFWIKACKFQGNVGSVAVSKEDDAVFAKVVLQAGGVAGHVLNGKEFFFAYCGVSCLAAKQLGMPMSPAVH